MYLIFYSVFSQGGIDLDKPLTTMCYNGHSACFLAFASALCGKMDTKVYYVSENLTTD